ncbi:hypothetical protein T484DRAFT_1891001 [Baffinella frigidus]|nr:hypothetical protein T484DRAFT_1891001 [Cryptophyta sp. CCMP2293]
MAMMVDQPPGRWSSGVCDFTDECCFCCYAEFCPCLAYGDLAAKMSKGRAWNSGEQAVTTAGYCCVAYCMQDGGCLAQGTPSL